MKNILILLNALLMLACSSGPVDLSERKQEVLNVEKRFNDYAKSQGLKSAFVEFVAPEAVLNRGGKVIEGPEAIGAYFDGFDYNSVSLTWKPDFVDVATSGDLAYTYGSFLFTTTDSIGTAQTSEGIFHTVWKRQEAGSMSGIEVDNIQAFILEMRGRNLRPNRFHVAIIWNQEIPFDLYFDAPFGTCRRA